MKTEDYPGQDYQALFDFFLQEHGLILTKGQMDDIINKIKKHLTDGK